jgi:breast cancer 2 susceptibility protein
VLKISGNSTTLARWDARLGPLVYPSVSRPNTNVVVPPVSTLRSLTNDGGVVSLLDVIVERIHPIAYIQNFKDKTRSVPINTAEYQKSETAWEVRLIFAEFLIG